MLTAEGSRNRVIDDKEKRMGRGESGRLPSRQGREYPMLRASKNRLPQNKKRGGGSLRKKAPSEGGRALGRQGHLERDLLIGSDPRAYREKKEKRGLP